MNKFKRTDLKTGMHVKVILKEDQRTGKLTEGIVKDILTKSPNHPHGIKVRLETGEVGRVKEIVE
ncbi:MAG: YwbE family protein [Ignavibacteriaceae bacterium]